MNPITDNKAMLDNMRGEVSVLMSVYNGALFLKPAIESILAQDMVNFEFIIIDDCSTDESVQIIRSYQDPRIVFIQNTTNLGLTKSLNLGLNIAKGKYIARMDCDDISRADRLQTQLNYMRSHPEVWVLGSGAIEIDSQGQSKSVMQMPSSSGWIRLLMLLGNNMIHPSVMFDKAKILAIGGYDESFKYSQDFDLWSRVLQKGGVLENLTEPLIQLRYHSQSISAIKQDLQKRLARLVRKKLAKGIYGFYIFEFELQISEQVFQKNKKLGFVEKLLYELFCYRLRKCLKSREDVLPTDRQRFFQLLEAVLMVRN